MWEGNEDAGYLRLVVEGVSEPRFHFEQGTLAFLPNYLSLGSLPRVIETDQIDNIDVGGPDIVILLRPNDVEDGVIDIDAIVNRFAQRGWVINHAVVGYLGEE